MPKITEPKNNLTGLAHDYKVSVKTMRKWIKPFLEEIEMDHKSRIFTPKQVSIIHKKLNPPEQ